MTQFNDMQKDLDSAALARSSPRAEERALGDILELLAGLKTRYNARRPGLLDAKGRMFAGEGGAIMLFFERATEAGDLMGQITGITSALEIMVAAFAKRAREEREDRRVVLDLLKRAGAKEAN